MKKLKRLFIVLAILMLGALTFSCESVTPEDRYLAVQELWPNAIILADPRSYNIWVIVDTSSTENVYFVLHQNWTTTTKISGVKRLYLMPLR